MKKMIVTDFDGTLIDDDEAVPMTTVLAIDKFRTAGNIFAIASGRIPLSVIAYNKDFNFIDYVISCNGSYIYSLKEDKVIYSNPLTKEIIRTVKQTFESDAIIYFCTVDEWHRYIPTIYNNKNNTTLPTMVKDFNRFLSRKKSVLYKIELHYFSREEAEENIKVLKKLKLDIECNLQTFGKEFFVIEITPKGNNKFEGIKVVSKYENIKNKDVIAIGDGHNDIIMVKKVGHGVAVDNACDELKKVAKEITLSNNDHGVEKVILDTLKENNML